MKSKYTILGTLLIVGVLGFFSYQLAAQKVPTDLEPKIVDLVKAQEMVAIDVRTTDELKENPSPGALHIPMAEIGTKIDTLDPKKKYVIFCESGGRAGMVVKKLKDLGFKEVYNLGSWRDWNKLNKK